LIDVKRGLASISDNVDDGVSGGFLLDVVLVS
jgi:hypothetical protein